MANRRFPMAVGAKGTSPPTIFDAAFRPFEKATDNVNYLVAVGLRATPQSLGPFKPNRSGPIVNS
jgi:hypothetical protein